MKQVGNLVVTSFIVLFIRVEVMAIDKVEVVARWLHLGNNVISLYSNGKIDDPSGDHTWSKVGNKLTLRWKDAKAPGGYWIDSCNISDDGLSYKGTNQNGRVIIGTLIKDPSIAKPTEKPDKIMKPNPPGTATAKQNATQSTKSKTTIAQELETAQSLCRTADVDKRNRGFEIYKELANQGDQKAIFQLSRCYRDAVGTVKNDVAAFQWFLRGSKAGDPLCTTWLGVCFQDGRGVEQDFDKAVELLKRGQKAGIADASTRL